jgi:hypothetical protein
VQQLRRLRHLPRGIHPGNTSLNDAPRKAVPCEATGRLAATVEAGITSPRTSTTWHRELTRQCSLLPAIGEDAPGRWSRGYSNDGGDRHEEYDEEDKAIDGRFSPGSRLMLRLCSVDFTPGLTALPEAVKDGANRDAPCNPRR